MKYFVKADHPILKRIDKFVDGADLGEFLDELSSLGYENISVDTPEQ
jgi:hypothetical protein